MNKSSVFHLTRRAALDLRDIYDRSRREWGDATANRYMADIYAAMRKAAANPDAGLLRKHRVAPFLMVRARHHFVVYDRIPQGIAILTLLHQLRDIEGLIANLSPSFQQEVEKLKAEKPVSTPKRGEKRKRE
jgi:plasmid stabilization system protein ParE